MSHSVTHGSQSVGQDQQVGPDEHVPVDFFFDPICPWAWAASRWMIQVEQVRPVKVRWRLFSLSGVFAERDKPEQFVEALELGWGTARAVVAAATYDGQTGVRAMYDQLGARMHEAGELPTADMVARCVAAAGVDQRVAEAVGDTSLDSQIWAEHAAAVQLVGEEIGTPIIAVGNRGFFGPVLTSVPKGEDAGRLFDGIRLCLAVEGFTELKRGRDVPLPDMK
jgi:2-hydroxychromene-2-carboxylate isomerase